MFGDGTFPVWKWATPESSYRKSGFWEAKLRHALQDGEWNGGKDLTILPGIVSGKTLNTIKYSESGRKFTILDRAETVAMEGVTLEDAVSEDVVLEDVAMEEVALVDAGMQTVMALHPKPTESEETN